MTESLVRNSAVAVAGGVGAALVGGYLSPIVSGSPYAPAVITGALGAGMLLMSKSAKWLDPKAGYGAMAAAGVLALGGVMLNAAKGSLQQAAQGNLVGAWRMADLQRLAPNSKLEVVAGNLTPPATAQAAIWASDHGYADRKMRAMGVR